MDHQAEEVVQPQQPKSPKRSSRGALIVLVAIVVAVPLWYFMILIPRVRMAAFREVMGDSNARGKVAFVNEGGGDSFGQVKSALVEGGVEPIPVSEVKPSPEAPKNPKDPSGQVVILSSLKWAGGNKYEVRAGWYTDLSKKTGSESTYIFQVSLFGCEVVEAKDQLTLGIKKGPGTGKPGMPGLSGATGGGAQPSGGGARQPAPSGGGAGQPAPSAGRGMPPAQGIDATK